MGRRIKLLNSWLI
ncbi:hypothetical protein LINPERHAP2_LOCUS36964 [Linum perenne]